MVTFHGIGPGPDGTGERLGCCSQLAMFVRMDVWRSTIHDAVENVCSAETIGGVDSGSTEYHLNELHNDIRKVDLNLNEFEIKDIDDQLAVEVDASDLQCKESRDFDGEYKLLGSFKFPINIDERTRDQRLLDEARFQIGRFEHMQGDFYNYDTTKYDVPLEMVSRFIVQEDHTMDELR